jgi:hypothetical protein
VVEGSQCCVRAPDRGRGEPQQRRGTICGAACPRREDRAAGDLMARRQTEPRGEVLGTRPRRRSRSALADPLERQGGAEPVDLGQLDTEDGMEGRAGVEGRSIGLPGGITGRGNVPTGRAAVARSRSRTALMRASHVRPSPGRGRRDPGLEPMRRWAPRGRCRPELRRRFRPAHGTAGRDQTPGPPGRARRRRGRG